MKRQYRYSDDFFEVDDVTRLPTATIAEAVIAGRSARALEMLGRWQQAENIAPSCVPVGFIRCANCGLYRARADFSPHKHTRTGLQTYCKTCHNAVNRESYHRKKAKKLTR